MSERSGLDTPRQTRVRERLPGGQQPALGINLGNVTKATVFDNRARSNSGTDLTWDGRGQNTLAANACETSTPAGTCAK